MGHTQSIMSAPTASSPIRALIMLALVVTAHGAGFGRRASFLTTTSGSFTLSGGSSRAGNDESLDLARDLGESLDDAPEHKDEDAAAQHQHTRQMVIMENHFQTVARKATQALAELGESSRTALSPYYKGILQRTLKWGLQKMRARMNTLKGKLKGKSKHNRARCTSPLLPGLVGGMPKKLCEPYQKVCFPPKQGWVGKKLKNWPLCLKHFKDPKHNNKLSCPDGIGPHGAMDARRCCIAWSSNIINGRFTTCKDTKEHRKICTTMAVVHPNGCEGDSGVLVFKRVVCKSKLCTVFKVGACLRVPGVKLKKAKNGMLNGLFKFRNRYQKNASAASQKFALLAEKLLANETWAGNKIPSEYLCRNTMTFKGQGGKSCAARGQEVIMVA